MLPKYDMKTKSAIFNEEFGFIATLYFNKKKKIYLKKTGKIYVELIISGKNKNKFAG